MPIIQTPNPELYDGQTPIERVLTRLERVKKHGDYYTASCPAHEDKHPSLSVSEGKDGKVLLKCHANCTFNQIMAALSLPREAAFPTEEGASEPVAPRAKAKPSEKREQKSKIWGKPVATYDYRDEMGELLFQTVRLEPKDFYQRHPTPSGGWVNNLNGARRVPYRLPELINTPPDRMVFIVEGEKDVERLREFGFAATCNPMGAGSWKPEYNEPLKDRGVVILADNDDKGRNHAQEVADSLAGFATSIKVVNLPGLPEKGDVSDWFDLGGDPDTLILLAEEAPELVTAPYERFPLHWAEEAIPQPPPIEYIIEGLMARGSITAFVGDAGTKKTWLLLAAALCIAKGIPFLGREVVQGPVLIIDEESGHRRLLARIHELMIGYGCLEPLPLVWITTTGFDVRNTNDMAQMRLRIEEIKPVFVMIDAFMEVIPGADENSVQEVLPAIKLLREVCQQYDFAGALIHHANKGGGYRGSSALKGVVDQMLMLTSQTDDPQVNIYSEKARDTDSIKMGAEVHFETYPLRKVWFTSTEPELLARKLSNSKMTVLEALRDKPQMSVKEIMDAAEERGICSAAAARNAVYGLVRDGEIKRVNRGGKGEDAYYSLG